MQATAGDRLLIHGRAVGQHDRAAQVLEVLGTEGAPPYRVRFEDDGHEAVVAPGPDCVKETPNQPRPNR